MSVLLGLFLLVTISAVSANSGAIWTTGNDCGNKTQNVNHYNIGDKVYINSKHFAVGGENSWTITGQPGNASCDPGKVVASGSYSVGPSGNFCFEAYTIQNDDCGEYKVDFGDKKDNYRINEPPIIPEFGIAAGMLTLASSIVILFFVRRK